MDFLDFTLTNCLGSLYDFAGIVCVATIFAAGMLLWRVVRAARVLLRVAATRGWPALARRWRISRLASLPAAEVGCRLTPGARVRLRGIVESEHPGAAALSGLPSVVSWHALGEVCGGTVGEGVAAHGFVLRLPDGTAVRVAADEAAAGGRLTLADGHRHHWTDRRRARAWYCESRVSPGDCIEVAGRLRRDLDPGAPRLRDRDIPLAWSVVADGQPLVLAFSTYTPARAARAVA